MNAQEVLNNINKMLEEAEEFKKAHNEQYIKVRKKWRIRDVCDDLGIFDWWDEYLSVSQLKSMNTFIEQGMKRGFCGYVCFKVGAKHCANGMWIHKNESTDGYSPDGACLYHSFVSGDNYWDMELDNGKWMHDLYPDKYNFTLKEIDEQLALEKATCMGDKINLEITFDELCVLEMALWHYWQIELSKNKEKYENDIEFAKELDYKLMTVRSEIVIGRSATKTI